MRVNRTIHLEKAAARENKPDKYGLTPDGYKSLFNAQNGKCWICGKPPGKRRLAVDHDHATGTVRGLLCHNCNIGLGNFHDNTAHLLRAVEYLSRYAT